MSADVVIRNGTIVPRVGDSERLQWLAADGGRIVAGGNGEPDISGDRVIDLQGGVAIPGLIDSHVHLMSTGMTMAVPEVLAVSRWDELADLVTGAATDVPDSERVLVYGVSIHRLDRRPSRQDIDAVHARRPVILLDRGGHGLLLNSRAAEWAKRALPRLPGDGLRTGFLNGVANTWLRNEISASQTDAERFAAYRRGARAAAAAGLTTVHALEGGEAQGKACFAERDAEALLDVIDQLAVRAVLYYQTTNVARVLELGLPRLGGCLWIDGSYGEHTAALFEPYHDDPTTSGTLYFSDSELEEFVTTANRAGLQISMHAIGDRAIEQLVTALERALADCPRIDHRHRIEHFSLPLAEHIERAARLDVCLAMQPVFASEACSRANLGWLGSERFSRRHPYRTILDRGLVVGAGSDSEAMPLDPLPAIRNVVEHPDRERRITVEEAFGLFTHNNAVLAFEERDKGTLERGKLADITVLDRDPFRRGCDLGAVRVTMTIVGARTVHEA